jgi:iron complex transport system substrate-binding protein
VKKRKKKVIWIAACLVIALGLSACGSKESSPSQEASPSASPSQSAGSSPSPSASSEALGDRELTDGLGHQVKIPANPQRIVASYLEDHLVALGVKPVAQWSVANGTQDYLKADLDGIPTIPFDLPFESVMSFQPDLLIIGSAATVEGDKYDQYAKIAPTYVVGDKINNDWRQSLLKIGEVLGKSDVAEKALADYEAKAAEAKAKLQQAAPEQNAAAIWLVSKKFFVVSQNLSSGSVLYQDLGLTVPKLVQDISKDQESNWLPISMEQIAQLDVDNLFLINSDANTGSEALQDPLWQALPVVKSGHVYEYPRSSSWLYTGTIANSQIIDDVLESMVK